MQLGELVFSDLLGFFQFLLKLLKSRSSGLAIPNRLLESDFESMGILW
jgi:hypothetical protein